jgi:hypothetical protein
MSRLRVEELEAELLARPELIMQALAQVLAPEIAKQLGQQANRADQSAAAPKRRRGGRPSTYVPEIEPNELQIARAHIVCGKIGLRVTRQG